MKPAIIGAGSWGTALATTAARATGSAILLARDAAKAADMERTRENSSRLPGVRLEDSITITADLEMLRHADCLFIATPAQSLRAMMTALAPFIAQGTPALIATKGIERGTHLFMSDVLREICPSAEPFCLSGPSFARDVAIGLPTAVTLAGPSLDQASHIANALSTPSFRIYASDDLRGVEIGGSVKNVLAIACGVVEGAGLGQNARAALIARGFAEMTRFGLARGAQAETLAGLSGLGDLVLTCSSISSRNFSLGKGLGEGQSAASLLADRKTVAEGAFTAPVLQQAAAVAGVEMPIVDAVCALLNSADIGEVVASLLSRPLKGEGAA